MVDKAPLVGEVRTGQVTTVLGNKNYTRYTNYLLVQCKGLTYTIGWCWRPGTSTSTSTHTSYRSSSTDGVPSVTGVGGHVGGCIV